MREEREERGGASASSERRSGDRGDGDGEELLQQHTNSHVCCGPFNVDSQIQPLKLLAVSVGLLFASFCFGFAFDS